MAAFVLPALIGGLFGASGWRTAWAVLGALAFLLGTLPTFLLRRQPEDLGMLPGGGRSPQREGRPSAVQTSEEPSFTLNQALHSSTFWVLLVGIAIGSLSNNGIPATMAASLSIEDSPSSSRRPA